MMKKIKKLLLWLLCISGLQSFAQQPQTFSLSGKVLEEKSRQPLANTGVVMLDPLNGKMIKSTLTDANGNFKLSFEPGRYTLKIAFISFKAYNLANQLLDKDTDLGTVLLREDVKLLKAVSVVGEKSSVELNLDKKVFNVGQDLASKGGTASDILNNVPSVSVDANGAVSLRGNSGVRVLINGKPSTLLNNNGLAQLPAGNVEKVEVITNPSARYEAQGGAGIINIVLKKNQTTGLNGSLQATAGDPANYAGNLNMSYKTEKFNLFANIGYRYRNQYGDGSIMQTTLQNGQANQLRQVWGIGRNDDLYNVYLGVDYYINEKNTITGSYNRGLLKNKDTTSYNYRYFNGNNALDSAISRFEQYREPQTYNRLDLDYVKTFDQKDRKWTTSLRYDFWNDDENQDIRQQKYFPAGNPVSQLLTRDIESSDDIYIQSDYVTGLGKTGRFEAGLRADLRAVRSDYWSRQDGILLEAFTNKLKYDENLYSGYLQYANKSNRFSYQLGLRAELSDIGISDSKQTFKRSKTYLSLFPTVHLTHSLQENTDLQLSYSRRIERPSFYMLNTFSGLSDTRNLTMGNPDLDPSFTDSFELAFLRKWGKFTINPSLYFSHNKNYIQYILKQGSAGFVSMPTNLAYENRYGLELNAMYNPLSWWRLSWDFNYYGYRQHGAYEGLDYSQNNQTWTTRINSRMRFAKNLSIEGTFNYIGRNEDVQAINQSQYRVNAALSKDFFKEQVSLTISGNNIFDSFVEKQVFTTANYRRETTFRPVGRSVLATLTYRFNRKNSEKDRLPE